MIDWTRARSLSPCVFPLLPNSKEPAIKSWEPYQRGQHATPAQIAEWAARGYQPGVPTNPTSGFIVFDIDNLAAWAEAESRGLPGTLTIKTPNGWHYYFQHPGFAVSNRVGAHIDGWDFRGDKGYVAGPGCYYVPSERDSARKLAGEYVIENDAPIAPMPDWLIELAKPREHAPSAPAKMAEETSRWGLATLHGCLADLAKAHPGNINDTINTQVFKVAQAVGGGEIVSNEAHDALLEGLRALGVGDEPKALDTFARAWEAGLTAPRAGLAPLSANELFGLRAPLLEGGQIDGDQHALVPEPPVVFGPAISPPTVTASNLQEYFAGCVFIASDTAMWMPTGRLAKREAFNVLYGGPSFYISSQNDKASKSAWDAFSNNEFYRLPRADRTVFRPEEPAGCVLHLEGLPVLNAYVPIRTARQAGDATPFVNHIHKLLPVGDDAEILLNWMASCVQNPGAKFQWWPVIQGVKGNGKTLILDVMTAAIGERYSHLVNAEALQRTGNQFNAWIDRKLFLGFEEIHTGEGQSHFANMMKTTVTNRRIAAEGKGVAQATIDNRANGIMLTNYDDAVPVDDEERRYGMFFTAQQVKGDFARDGMDGEYFPNLWNWLRAGGFAIITDYLHTYALRDEMDPARGWKAPVTSSTRAAKRSSLGNVELEVLDRIEQGAPGFRGGWISSVMFGQVMERMRIGRKRWPAILKTLGYEQHPNLSDGRVGSPLTDQTRPRLYVCKGHSSLSLHGTAIGEAYEADQNASVISNVVPFSRP